MEKQVIDSFRGQYEFLSNFHREADGLTVEHRFQPMKAANPAAREPFPASMPPGKAKYHGRRLPLRADWEKVKTQIMESLVREKFEKSKVLAAELLSTGDAELIEGNTWRDTTWGMIRSRDGRWKGENRLGKILMKIGHRPRRVSTRSLNEERYNVKTCYRLAAARVSTRSLSYESGPPWFH